MEWGATEIHIYTILIHYHKYIYDAYEVAHVLILVRDPAFLR